MSNFSSKSHKESEYFIQGGLENLIKRLKKGMQLKGRIIECKSDNQYLLRIWGYNILTESKKTFKKFDEVKLIVKAVSPHLILDFVNLQKHKTNQPSNVKTNVLV
jgi:hypothetical protein